MGVRKRHRRALLVPGCLVTIGRAAVNLVRRIRKRPRRQRVLLSLGMGYESAALLLRWLLYPETCPCPLERLVVVTAMTGEEYERTEELMAQCVLPLMRRRRVRYVQLCRAGQADTDGYVVLSDSRRTRWMRMRGPWRLGDEYQAAGTVVQQAGARICSQRAKGWVIDLWVRQEFGDEEFAHAIGFNRDETRRVERDRCYGATEGRRAIYPLVDWDWSREDAALFLLEATGEIWCRSCCVWCPYQAGKAGQASLIERWRRQPEAGARAIVLERAALALNPNAKLFGTAGAAELVAEHGLAEVAQLAEEMLLDELWAVYRVRRVYLARGGDPQLKGPAWRSVEQVTGATYRRFAHLDLHGMAALSGLTVEVDEHGLHRASVLGRGETYPATEAFLTAAPAFVRSKERKGFHRVWTKAAGAGTATEQAAVSAPATGDDPSGGEGR